MNYGQIDSTFRPFEKPRNQNQQYRNIRSNWNKLIFEDYQDIVSTIKERVLSGERNSNGKKISRAYVRSCITNELIDRYRKSKTRKQLEMAKLKPLEEYVLMTELALEDSENHNLKSLHALLVEKGLTELEAALLIGRVGLGDKYDILAEELRISDIDARVIVKNALRKVRRKVKKRVTRKRVSIEELPKTKKKYESK